MAGDKTEKASPKKRRDERKKGNVFKSQDIVTVVSLLGSFCSLRFLFPVIYESTVSYAKKCIAGVGELKDFQALGGGYYLRDLLFQFIKSSLPLLLVAVFMAALGVGSQTKFLFTMKNAMPKFSRLNPIGGIRKIISLKSVVELSKSLIKIIVLLSVLYQFLKRCLPFVTASLNISSLGAASSLLQYIYSMILKVVMWFGVIAAFDFLYQWLSLIHIFHKLSGELFYLNEDQIEMVKFIPETKIVMMNKEFYIVQDSGEQVVEKIIEFKRKIMRPVGEEYPEGKEELLRRE